MKIAFSGHQHRPGIRWAWVSATIQNQLIKLDIPLVGFCCLAGGSDQLFAKELLAIGGSLTAVIPRDDYSASFSNDSDRTQYESLRRLAHNVVELHLATEVEESFFQASRFAVDQSSVLFAVWDEKPAKGRGGTADVVHYAIEKGREVLIMNPLTEAVHWKGL